MASSQAAQQRLVNGSLDILAIDEGVEENGERMPQGISFFGSGLEAGECGITINSVNEDHLGFWGCVLFTTITGRVVGGQVHVDVHNHLGLEVRRNSTSAQMQESSKSLVATAQKPVPAQW